MKYPLSLLGMYIIIEVMGKYLHIIPKYFILLIDHIPFNSLVEKPGRTLTLCYKHVIAVA